MKLKLTVVVFFIWNLVHSQSLQWVRQIKGLEDKQEYASFIEIDKNGNTYTLGKSQSHEYDIDPTEKGVQIIKNKDFSPEDVYLIKLNSDGDFIWGKSLSILKVGEDVFGLKFDSQGNIYVLAYMSELYKNQSQIYGYGFINVIKIDPNGNEIYRRKFQTLGNINDGKLIPIASFDIDSSDNIYVAGAFQNTVQLDNNPKNDLVANGNSTYVFKLNQNGTILWSKNLNCIISGGFSLKTDSNNDINLLFNCFNKTNTGSLLSILKLNNSSGNLIWSKALESTYLFNFTLTHDNNFIIAGRASNDIIGDVNPDPNISTPVKNQSYILFLDSNGNYLDVKLFHQNIRFKAIEVDDFNNYHFVGNFGNDSAAYYEKLTADFDPSSNNFYLSSEGHYGEDGFYLKLNENKEFVHAFMLGPSKPPLSDTNKMSYYTRLNSLKILDENIYIAGEFGGDGCDLDPSLTSSYILNSFTGNVINLDGVILKIRYCDTNAPKGDSNQSFCASQNPTINNLTPNSSSTTWYNTLASTTPLQKNTALVDGQSYFVSRQLGSCPETKRQEVVAHLSQNPTPPTALSQLFCEDENATISKLVATGSNIKWYESQTNGNSLQSDTKLQNNTTYYVSQTVNGCESDKTAVSVTINPNISPSISSPQSFCFEQYATLKDISVSGQNIKWYDGLVGGNLLPASTVLMNGTTYYASQTVNGCESSRTPVSTNIVNTPIPTGFLAQTLCGMGNPTLNDIVVSGTDIIWYDSFVGGNVLPDNTVLKTVTTYYCTQTLNGCESWRKPVNVVLIDKVDAKDYSATICDDLNDGTESINLESYKSNIITNISDYSFKYFSTLTGAENDLLANQISNTSEYKLDLGENKIYVRTTFKNICYSVVELKLIVIPSPVINMQDIYSLCQNDKIIIKADSGFDSYLWSTGETSSAKEVNKPGNYSVTVTENHGTTICSSTKNITVVESNTATITSIETQDWSDNQNKITVFATGEGDYEYSLDGINFQDSNEFSGLNQGTYTVYVRDKNGCGTVTQEVYLLMYAKYFTPNGDGNNDSWKIKLSVFEPGLKVLIMDRYGKVLKQLLHPDDSWDGTFNGVDQPADDYWFVVSRKDGREHKGHFALKR